MPHTLLSFFVCLWHLIGVFGYTDSVKSVSVMEGDSVTLNPDLTDIQRDEEIEWRFNNSRITRVIMNITRYYNDERFRDRLKLDQTGSLTISDIRTTDSGLYQLSAIIRNEEIIKRFSVTVNGVFGDTDSVKSVSVMEGDSVTLNPDLTDIQRDEEIQWRFNNSRITRVSKDITRYDNDERFRDRLKLDQTGSLTIRDIRTTDSGLYQLSDIIGNEEIIKRFNVTVNAKTTTPQSPSSSESENAEGNEADSQINSTIMKSDQQTPSPPPVSVSQIVLISSAVAGSLMVVAVGIFWICRKHRKTEQQVQSRDEEITYADPMFYKRNAQKETVTQEEEVVYAGVVTRR